MIRFYHLALITLAKLCLHAKFAVSDFFLDFLLYPVLDQKFQKCEYAKTKLFKTEGRGWGLLADQHIKVIHLNKPRRYMMNYNTSYIENILYSTMSWWKLSYLFYS